MKNLKSILLSVLIMSFLLLVSGLIISNIVYGNNELGTSVTDSNMVNQKNENKENTQFQFSSTDSSDLPEKQSIVNEQNREIYGYEKDIAIGEAATIFNDQQKRFPYFATLPPLTKDEIVASIISPDYISDSIYHKQRDIIFQILEGGMLPKGSLLVGEGGGCVMNSPLGKNQICAKGQRIYIFFGLDKNPRMSEPLNPNQIFLIRKSLFNIER